MEKSDAALGAFIGPEIFFIELTQRPEGEKGRERKREEERRDETRERDERTRLRSFRRVRR